jgi:hypothetical protein
VTGIEWEGFNWNMNDDSVQGCWNKLINVMNRLLPIIKFTYKSESNHSVSKKHQEQDKHQLSLKGKTVAITYAES